MNKCPKSAIKNLHIENNIFLKFFYFWEMFLFFPDNINNGKKNSVWTIVWTALKFDMDTITYFPYTLVGFAIFFIQWVAMTQWIRCLPTEQEILVSSPSSDFYLNMLVEKNRFSSNELLLKLKMMLKFTIYSPSSELNLKLTITVKVYLHKI